MDVIGWQRAALLTVVVGVVVVLAGAVSVVAAPAARGDVVWLCHPGQSPDPCDMPLDTTLIAPDGSRSTFTPASQPEAQRPVDCFYVYPTVSNQVSVNATKAAAPEVTAVTQYQAARFSSTCRMFVPLYREVTVAGVAGNLLPAAPIQEAYGDVLEAFKQYLAQDNDGRGFILMGHSQGSILLRELIRTQIDPNPALRKLLVGAFILGGNVTVKAGSDRGGDFQNIPLCTVKGQFGCVVAYSTYSTDPSSLSFFGNTDADTLSLAFGEPHGQGYQVACTDPGPLTGDTAPQPVLVPTAPFPPGFIASGITATVGNDIPSASTTWVEGYSYAASCQTINGTHVLRYYPVSGSPQFNQFPPLWGTHLIDWQLGLDRLTLLGRDESEEWLSSQLAVGTPQTSRARGTASVPVAVPGAGVVKLLPSKGYRRASRSALAPGTVTLPVVPAGTVKRTLARKGLARVVVRIAYTPYGDPAVIRTVRLRLTLNRKR